MLVEQTYKLRARRDQRLFRGYAYRKGQERRAGIYLFLLTMFSCAQSGW